MTGLTDVAISVSVVSQTPPSTHSDPSVPSVNLSNIPDDGTLGESTVSESYNHHSIMYHCCRYLSSS